MQGALVVIFCLKSDFIGFFIPDMLKLVSFKIELLAEGSMADATVVDDVIILKRSSISLRGWLYDGLFIPYLPSAQ